MLERPLLPLPPSNARAIHRAQRGIYVISAFRVLNMVLYASRQFSSSSVGIETQRCTARHVLDTDAALESPCSPRGTFAVTGSFGTETKLSFTHPKEEEHLKTLRSGVSTVLKKCVRHHLNLKIRLSMSHSRFPEEFQDASRGRLLSTPRLR